MKKKLFVIFLSMVCALSIVLSGCSAIGKDKSPITAIQDAYGNEQFRISFSSENLDEPISDMYYTAYDIPALPTPVRVGYVFAGWYFDSAYTLPFEDDSLYLYMRDVTLYARWTKEEFSNNGTYAIEFTTKILEDTVREGSMSTMFGGYKNFGDAIIAEDTYIEKTGDGLFLKIQYDNGVVVPESSIGSVFTVSSELITERVTAETETEKTVWLNISEIDLAEAIPLNIQYINWEAEGLSTSERNNTATTYTLEFEITRLIGFDRPFANINTPLEDGYYLVRSYFFNLDSDSTMLENYNSVYSYLYAENNHYTLIKPFSPYLGLLRDTGYVPGNETVEEYYYRLAVYYKMWYAFRCDIPDNADELYNNYEGDYEFLQAECNAGNFITMTYEYNSETGKSYNLIELGNDLTQDIVLMGVASGFMEAAWGTAPSYKQLVLDFDTMVRVSDVDYQPIDSNEYYAFTEDMQAYPFDGTDFASNGTSKDMVETYGLTEKLNIFFFSSSDEKIDTTTIGGQIYSSRITITPVGSTAETPVNNMRYSIAQFSVYNQVYGYEAEYNDLCSQSMTVRSLGGYSLFDKNRERKGQSCTQGETINLREVFQENVLSEYSGTLGYQAYRMNDGEIDFRDTVDLPASGIFNFSEDIAVLFTCTNGDDTITSLYEFSEYSEPEISISNYNTSTEYNVGNNVPAPVVVADWMGKETEFVMQWSGNADAGESINPLWYAYYTVSGDIYNLVIMPDLSDEEGMFVMLGGQVVLAYEIQNPYGERIYEYFEFYAAAATQPNWAVKNSQGEIVAEGDIRTTTQDGQTVRICVEEEDSSEIILSLSDLDEFFRKKYIFQLYGMDYSMPVGSVKVYTREKTVLLSVEDYTDLDAFKNAVIALIDESSYALLTFSYQYDSKIASGVDIITQNLLYNFSYGGRSVPNIVWYDTYYAGYSYGFRTPEIMAPDGNHLANGTIGISRYVDGEWERLDSSEIKTGAYSTSVTFTNTGLYRLTYSATMRYDLNGSLIFGGNTAAISVNIFSVDLMVEDPDGNVQVTYITDEEHPFADGSTSMTIEYSLMNTFRALDSEMMRESADRLYGWGLYTTTQYSDYNYVFRANGVLNNATTVDFIKSFNTNHLVLYAIWDKGATVTIDLRNGQLVEKELWLSSNLGYELSLDYYEYADLVPSGYVHAGWSGDIFEDGYTHNVDEDDSIYISGDCTITAVYKILLTVKYNINAEYSSSRKINDRNIIDGYTLEEAIGEDAVNSRMDVSAKSGYKFRYWGVLIEGEMREFNLYSDAISSELTESSTFELYAVFEDAEGNLVW